jgi:glycogen synthase
MRFQNLMAICVLHRASARVHGSIQSPCAADWFAGLVPIYLAARYRPGGIYLGARCIMLVHNLCHQGVYPPGTFELLGLPGDWYQSLEWQYPPEQRQGAYEEEGRAINTLKGAITTADRIVAVSPGVQLFTVVPVPDNPAPGTKHT